MEACVNSTANGWKPLPLILKIFSILIFVWTIGSIINILIFQNHSPGILFTLFWLVRPLFSFEFFSIIIFFDSFSFPLLTLFLLIGIWLRKSWTPIFAYLYLGLFVLTTLSFILNIGVLGIPRTLLRIPSHIVKLSFLIIVLAYRSYFKPRERVTLA